MRSVTLVCPRQTTYQNNKANKHKDNLLQNKCIHNMKRTFYLSRTAPITVPSKILLLFKASLLNCSLLSLKAKLPAEASKSIEGMDDIWRKRSLTSIPELNLPTPPLSYHKSYNHHCKYFPLLKDEKITFQSSIANTYCVSLKSNTAPG